MFLRAFCILVIGVLLFSGSLQTLSFASSASAQSAVNPLRMTLIYPPNSLNEITITSASSAYFIVELEQGGAVPAVLPNGSDDVISGITDRYTHNLNYTVWMFHVKPGLKWSDGTNVTSADILATFGPKFAFLPLYDIWGIGPEVANEYAQNISTAVYVLNLSDAHFGDKLRADVFTSVYQAKFVNNGGANSTDFGTNVGDGPFYVSNYTGSAFQLKMLRNSYFTPQPTIPEIDINFVDTLSLTAGQLLAGSSDFAPVEPTNVPALLKNPNLGVFDEKGLGVSSLEYNVTMYPYNMTQFRQALVYGINETQYVHQAFNGFAIPGYSSEGIVSPSAQQWYNPNQQQYSYNASHALSLLSSIGIAKGTDGYLHYPNGTISSLTIWADTDNTQDVVGANSIQANLQALGFKVNIVTTSASNIVGYFSSNVNDIRSGMILYSNGIPVWGLPWLDALPAWTIYWLPTTAMPTWEYPPSANAEYESNYSAFQQTNNASLEKTYLNNIEALNAQYLPTLILAYPDSLWGYSRQHWTNWPVSGNIYFGASLFNWTAFVDLVPAGTQTTTTTSSAISSSSSTNSSSGGSAAPTNDLAIAAAVIVVIAAIGVISVYSLRRRSRTT